MLNCFFGAPAQRRNEPKLVSIVVVNQLPELVFFRTSTFKYCPICMDERAHSTKFRCVQCRQCICEGCAKSIVRLHGSSSMCSLCRVQPMCGKSENEIIRAHNDELVRSFTCNP